MNQVIEIPNKSFFKLNEVCALTSVKPYVLRFWESEFEEISPTTSSTGQKLYEHKDIEAIFFIKKLLFEDKLTVEKAKAEIMTMLSPSKSELEDTIESQEDDSEDFDSLENIIDQELSVSRKALTENELNKLFTAKQKLADILSRTQTIKNTHNWVQ
ncbi:MerR family transcriptional regulator [Bacteriovoracaceae bacterium]|nr:MerR family transcriptional regulator [Bacteriovoracaceae bacterium]|tara:strand:+ start:170012 stop:170482 length:471 start_codon:yes stop_codon:yes gene_type:complete